MVLRAAAAARVNAAVKSNDDDEDVDDARRRHEDTDLTDATPRRMNDRGERGAKKTRLGSRENGT